MRKLFALADRPAPSERNRARREAMEEAANLVENSVDENTAGILTIRSDIGDKIRALAADQPDASREEEEK